MRSVSIEFSNRSIQINSLIQVLIQKVSFNLGEPVNDTTMDGRNVEMTVKDTTPSGGDLQGGPPVWTETQVSSENLSLSISRIQYKNYNLLSEA